MRRMLPTELLLYIYCLSQARTHRYGLKSKNLERLTPHAPSSRGPRQTGSRQGAYSLAVALLSCRSSASAIRDWLEMPASLSRLACSAVSAVLPPALEFLPQVDTLCAFVDQSGGPGREPVRTPAVPCPRTSAPGNAPVCVCVCVCVERERERERVSVCVCVCARAREGRGRGGDNAPVWVPFSNVILPARIVYLPQRKSLCILLTAKMSGKKTRLNVAINVFK